MIGTSLSLCVRYFVLSHWYGSFRERESFRPPLGFTDVEYIVAGTLIPNEERLEGVFKIYQDALWGKLVKSHSIPEDYWLDASEGDQLARWFWKEGRVRQPRLSAPAGSTVLVPDSYVCPLFVETEADIIWMEVGRDSNQILETGIKL